MRISVEEAELIIKRYLDSLMDMDLDVSIDIYVYMGIDDKVAAIRALQQHQRLSGQQADNIKELKKWVEGGPHIVSRELAHLLEEAGAIVQHAG